ncbi:MAG TPA: Holliday junction branch migration protein RuvA [Sedimentisphaerales bacterium]|nr:Holliday junction branch migration protein RuvA [Sedimentisphaerales bacterium]
MIAGIEGQLVELGTETAQVKVGAVTYEVMLPGYCIAALSGQIGGTISLCTMEYYEGSLGGGNLVPRLVGFLSPVEREFFGEFISVKGLGIRKGLRALSLPIADVAGAVESGDEKMLMTLSGIGRKMAQSIVSELKGKLQGFAFGAQSAPGTPQTKLKPFQTEALEILIAWGEKRNEAMELIEQASQRHPEIQTAEELVPIVYRVKQGAEG